MEPTECLEFNLILSKHCHVWVYTSRLDQLNIASLKGVRGSRHRELVRNLTTIVSGSTFSQIFKLNELASASDLGEST